LYGCVAVGLTQTKTLVPQKFRTHVLGVVCKRFGTFTKVVTNLEETGIPQVNPKLGADGSGFLGSGRTDPVDGRSPAIRSRSGILGAEVLVIF